MTGKMGLGVFIIEAAGGDRIACHQAANNGFRGIYFVCFHGPDKGKGIIALTNSDDMSVLLICKTM